MRHLLMQVEGGTVKSESEDSELVPADAVTRVDELTAEERQEFESERAELKQFIDGLSAADIKSGTWFTKLITHGLVTYATKTDWKYFEEQYPGVPADAIVDQRIKMAARYASLAGGLSAAAYTGAVVATIGSLSAASPITVPAAIGTLMFDLSYVTVAQLRLAHDVAVLYRVPLDVNDPADIYKLIRVAFTIKSGQVTSSSLLKVVPAFLRFLLKKFYSGSVLAAAKSLPFIGKYLLQRTVIKVALPGVGIPLAVGVNYWTTIVAGKHARAVFRNEARVIESSRRIMEPSRHPQLVLWVAWLVVNADRRITDDEALMLRHLMIDARELHQVVDEQLAQTIDLDAGDVWRRIDGVDGDLNDVIEASRRVATIDGEVNELEQAVLDQIAERCRRG